MITLDGDVVGVNTAMINGAQGLSFSVNIETAKEIAAQLIQHGKVFKAYLGLMLQEVPMNPKIARHYHLKNQKGLFITAIEPGSPASRSQLMEGDIIVSFNNKPVNSTQELFKALTHRDILTMTDVGVVRHTQLLTVTITPVEKK